MTVKGYKLRDWPIEDYSLANGGKVESIVVILRGGPAERVCARMPARAASPGDLDKAGEFELLFSREVRCSVGPEPLQTCCRI